MQPPDHQPCALLLPALAAHGTGCQTNVGVCGKTPEVSILQDLLIYQLQGIAQYVHEARKAGGTPDADIDLFLLEGMFST